MRETLKSDLMKFWFFLLHKGLVPNEEGAELLTPLRCVGKTCTVAADSSNPKASFLGRVGWQLLKNFHIVTLLFLLYRSDSYVPVLNTLFSVCFFFFPSPLIYLISYILQDSFFISGLNSLKSNSFDFYFACALHLLWGPSKLGSQPLGTPEKTTV